MPVIALSDSNWPEREIGKAIDGKVLDRIDPRAPIVIMIHGFRYCPSVQSRDPHRQILGLSPDTRARGGVSWPRRLNLSGPQGLGVAWGWAADGTIWTAHRRAVASGVVLARVISRLRAAAPDRPIHIIAHSLGARVASSALRVLDSGDVQRIVLLAAALSKKDARLASASAAGRHAEIINIRGTENWLFDMLLWLALPWSGRRLGMDDVITDRWVDLSLDDPDVLERLGRLGWRVAPPLARICHWSGYLRPGVWKFHRALLVDERRIPLSAVRAAAAEEPVTPFPPGCGLIDWLTPQHLDAGW